MVGKSLDSLVREIRSETLSQITLYDLQGKLLASTFSVPLELPAETPEMILAQQDVESGRRAITDANGNSVR